MTALVRTAVDSSVLLDVFSGSSEFGTSSREALKAAELEGSLLASEVVWGEVRAHFSSRGAFERAMRELGAGWRGLEDLSQPGRETEHPRARLPDCRARRRARGAAPDAGSGIYASLVSPARRARSFRVNLADETCRAVEYAARQRVACDIERWR